MFHVKHSVNIKYILNLTNLMFHVKHLVDIIRKRWYTKSMQKTER